MICSSKLKTLKKLALAVSFLTITASFAMEDSDEERRGSQQSLSTEERERLQTELNELERMNGMRGARFRGRIQELRNILGIEERVDVTRQEALSQDKDSIKTNFSKLPKIINLIPDKIHAVNLLPRTLKEVEFSLMELLKDQSIK